MDDIKILATVERYIRGEMTPDERLHFENLRKTNAEIDQLVVEHTLFLQQLNHFGERKNIKTTLNTIHVDLTEQGKIDSMRLKGGAKIVYLWKRYRRVAAIAASIAGITTLTVSALVWVLTPRPNSNVQEMSRQLEVIKKEQKEQKSAVNDIQDQINTDKETAKKIIHYKSGGTGFLIDGKGYLITNAHIIRNSKNIVVVNTKGEVIGVISTKEVESEGVAFAIQSKYIFSAIEDLKKDTVYQSLKPPVKSSVRGMDKKQQVKKIQDYVFMVKGD